MPRQTYNHKGPAVAILGHLFDRVIKAQNTGDAINEVKITYGNLASMVVYGTMEKQYTVRNIKYPLGLIKRAIIIVNKERSFPIPQISFIVVDAGSMLAHGGADELDMPTSEIEQANRINSICEFVWSDNVRSILIEEIKKGPPITTAKKIHRLL